MSLSKSKPLNLLSFLTVIGKICLNQIADQENYQRTLLYCWWECKLVQPLWRTVCRFLEKQNRATIWHYNPTPGHIFGEKQNPKGNTHPSVHWSTIYNSQDMEEVSIDRGMDKEDVVHIYNGILFSHLKEWNNDICSNIDGPRECQAEWNKSDSEGNL